ncbi:acriflavin resistance protein [Rhodopseudomonas sp. P2A-2r]|uniref:acriflavin resistance protein n=1 Tax=unclassified Rhodopseudomonas TaxID=2638247 RepID=UPI0022345F59|nr:acriflavin resistance protein [Rhodopseudomonas sp. P2A-2r]UZE47351.1 acriflavin resistance protein [Rhodopseudomonas sp. P2A-2r]
MTDLDTLFNGMTGLAGTFGHAVSGVTSELNHLMAVADDNPDGWGGLLMSGLAGAATAVAVAIALSLYFHSGYRSSRDLVRHGVGAVAALVLLAFAVSDVRHAALNYLGMIASKPAIEFEIRLPDAVAAQVDTSATQIELHTDRNQTLASLREGPTFTSAGESILRGSVPLVFRTANRTVILNLPGQAQRLFRLRLAPSPSQSAEFGPWHLVDEVATARSAAPTRADDVYAIRYRVI